MSKGPSIKDVGRDEGREGWSNAHTCGQREGVKDLADVRKLVLFLLFQHALQTLPVGDAYYSINCYSSDTICTTEYNMGWY